MSTKHILVADDEAHTRDTLNLILNSRDYLITEASDGIQALEILEQSKVDLIILDVRMPRMGGLEFLDELDKRKLNVPVIVISGITETNFIAQLEKSGCEDIVFKPFNEDDILEAVDRIFEN